jgi:hypothetical protein
LERAESIGISNAVIIFLFSPGCISLADKHTAELGEWGLSADHLTGARKHLSELIDANTAQESAVKNLSPKTRELYEAKGRAYLLLKRLARTGRTVFADDPSTAAKLNLDILNRSGSKSKAAKTPA